MRTVLISAIALFAMVGSPSLEAQRPLSLSLGGGVSIPQGDLADGVDLGWHALAVIERSSPMQPMSLRLDVAYNQWAFSDDAVAGDGESQNTISGTLNLAYRLPSAGSAFGPYLITGLGAYRTDCSLDGCDPTIRFGWNAGLGVKMFSFGFRHFVEARYHRTRIGDTSLSYFPITIAVTF